MREIVGYPGEEFLGHSYEVIKTKSYDDGVDAWDEFEELMEKFLDGKWGTVVWRIKPKLKENMENGMVYVMAKLLVYPDNIIRILRKKGLIFWRNGKGRNNPYNINEIPKEFYGDTV